MGALGGRGKIETPVQKTAMDMLPSKASEGDFIKMCQNTLQLCWGDEWPTLSPGGRGLG